MAPRGKSGNGLFHIEGDVGQARRKDGGVQPPPFKSLTASVASALQRDLVAGCYLPGDKLPIATLAKHYEVSPGAVREALARLIPEGLVEFSEQRGFRVAPVSIEALMDITRTRILIDGQALRQSIANGTVNWEADVLAAHHRLANCRQVGSEPLPLTKPWDTLHREFHRSLIMACGSEWLIRFHDLLFDHTERYRSLSAKAYAQRSAEVPARDLPAEHARLAEAAVARDVEGAVDLLERHYVATAERIVAWQGTTLGETEAQSTGA